MVKKGKRRCDTLPVLHPDAAGIDVGASELFVAVSADRDPHPVRSFPTFTRDLHALADWLEQCGIHSVAMESTSVYWIPIYQILEARGLEVYLVNAQHVKNVPGRKTDVSDCQWLQYLHSVGLLRASFRPPGFICAIRSLWRHRSSLIQMAAEHVLHMQKALDQMNLLGDLQTAATAEKTTPARTKASAYQRRRYEPKTFDLRGELYRIFGVDLTNVPGISAITAQTILCEIGTDVSRFRNASAFASWLGLCPEKKVSGGKVLFTKSRRVRSRVATALRMGAQSLHHAKDYLGEFFRRITRKLGRPQAITATAHKLARIVYHLLGTKEVYNESVFHKSEADTIRRAEYRLRRQAAQLGFQVIPAENG
jgi:transposase